MELRRFMAVAGIGMLLGVTACGGSGGGLKHDITGDWMIVVGGSSPQFMHFDQAPDGSVSGHFDADYERMFTTSVVGSLVDDAAGRYEITAKVEMFWPGYVFIDAFNLHVILDDVTFSGTCDVPGPGGALRSGLPCQGAKL